MTPTVEEIKRAVCSIFWLRMSDMVSPDRHRCVARPRQIAMFLAYQMTRRSYPEIGVLFGWRDHSTAMHAAKQIAALLATDADIADDIERVRQEIAAQIARRRPAIVPQKEVDDEPRSEPSPRPIYRPGHQPMRGPRNYRPAFADSKAGSGFRSPHGRQWLRRH